MSFSLYALACRGIPKSRKTQTGFHPSPGRMQSLQSKTGPVLGLHSCRALTPHRLAIKFEFASNAPPGPTKRGQLLYRVLFVHLKDIRHSADGYALR